LLRRIQGYVQTYGLRGVCCSTVSLSTRDRLNDKRLGEELIIDIAHYQQRPDCRALVCFVYDQGHHLKNPQALENDLSKRHNELDVRVLIRPKS